MDLDKSAQEINDDEGYKPHPYKDSRGYDTIGIGFLCDERIKGSGLTKEECLWILKGRIAKLAKQIDLAMPWVSGLSDVRQRAIMNMCYQMGVSKVLGFVNMLSSLKSGKYADAAKHGLDSDWARQTPARAKRVTDMIRYG